MITEVYTNSVRFLLHGVCFQKVSYSYWCLKLYDGFLSPLGVSATVEPQF